MSNLLATLAKSLFERIPEAQIVPGAIRHGQEDDWQPQENDCHTNVATWVHHFPETSHVRGFLLFDFEGLLPYVWFTPHSVLRLEDGRLVDITPSRASQRYPFIEHLGTNEEWAVAERANPIEFYYR